MKNVAFNYGVVNIICESIKWVEQTLVKDETFSLPKKRHLLEDDIKVEAVLIDATECEIERPKKTKRMVSGKKKKHTIKIQIIADATILKIYSIAQAKGSIHDFNLFKESYMGLPKQIKVQADNGYQGIKKIHNNSEIPKKASKLHP